PRRAAPALAPAADARRTVALARRGGGAGVLANRGVLSGVGGLRAPGGPRVPRREVPRFRSRHPPSGRRGAPGVPRSVRASDPGVLLPGGSRAAGRGGDRAPPTGCRTRL